MRFRATSVGQTDLNKTKATMTIRFIDDSGATLEIEADTSLLLPFMGKLHQYLASFEQQKMGYMNPDVLQPITLRTPQKFRVVPTADEQTIAVILDGGEPNQLVLGFAPETAVKLGNDLKKEAAGVRKSSKRKH